MATNDYEQMSVEELEGLAATLAEQSAQLSGQRKAVAQALTAKRSAAKARARLAAMPDAERAVLAQLLRADGIPGGEEFGQIGN